MKLLTLKLRGATGIHNGIGLDEIYIDFTRFQPGLVALVGTNGSGKSTILENLHPYLQLVSRDGSLSNHFRLRDSFRDLTFEVQGHVYRTHILIDAHTAKTEAYLYKDGQPLNDGKVNTYKVEIEKLLGSPELFFRSIFSAQNSESITSLTAGKRKELFMELLGLQKYDRYAEECRLKIDNLEGDITRGRGKLEQIYSETSKRQLVEEELNNLEIGLDVIEKSIKLHEAQKLKDEDTVKLNEQRIVENNQRQVQIHDLGNEISVLETQQWKLKNDFDNENKRLGDQRKTIQEEIDRKAKIIGHKDEIEKNVLLLKVSRTQLKAIEERKAQLAEIEQEESAAKIARQKAENEYNQQVNDIDGKIILSDMEMRSLNQKFDNEIKERERQLQEAQTNSALIDEVPCSKIAGLPEQCKLLSAAIEARNKIEELQDRIFELKEKEYRTNMGLGSLEKQIEELRLAKQSIAPLDELDLNEYESRKRSVGYSVGDYLQIKQKVEELEKGSWESLLEELRIAESVIEEKRKALDELQAQAYNLASRYDTSLEESKTNIAGKRSKWEALKSLLLTAEDLKLFKDRKDALEAIVAVVKEENDRRSAILGDIKFRQEMLKKLDELKIDAETIEEKLTAQLQSLEHHKLLHRACSKDGIPALELDAAGPEVSRIANNLLSSTFGSRFQIAFETTKLTKDKKKQVETFDIRVYGEEGEKKIEDLSGGQRVWIEAALQEAIAIYNSEKSGKEFLTSFQDEKDGALDPDNKQHFVEMLRESFRIGRRYFTFVITQTPDIWQQVQQRLHLDPVKGTIEQVL